MTPTRPGAVDMVVDMSALLAVMFAESDRRAIVDILAEARGPVMSAGNVTEALIVAEARVPESGPTALISFIESAEIVIHLLDAPTARLAAQAWSQFGKGRHPAGLNYGDCFSYALARHLEVPLVSVGNDFRQTDVVVIP